MNEAALQAFTAHVLSEYPKEACGVLVGEDYIPCTNVADNPLRDFKIAPKELATIKAQHGKITAVLHSHPYHPRMAPTHPPEWPSAHDMHSWIKSKKPWGIVATDGEGLSQILWLDEKNREPLVGREFVWGKNDCYSLIRDWFKQERKITLPNFPRTWKFWEQGQALYDDNFAQAGFVEIKAEEATIGDCILVALKGNVSTHAAVITGPDEILHHVYHRLSGFDSLHKQRRRITKYLRYVGQPT
jgi:proteasome lid subunit RPN8/RPN11